ncbi:hypothetical protein LTR94_038241 [Friedmanniomyces endolithicus]|nr:hypothetical protein LTR94_038241 [Friedmanniomyces endolithicus]
MAQGTGLARDRDRINRGEPDDALGEDDDDIALTEPGTLLDAGVERMGAGVEIVDAVHDRSFRVCGE